MRWEDLKEFRQQWLCSTSCKVWATAVTVTDEAWPQTDATIQFLTIIISHLYIPKPHIHVLFLDVQNRYFLYFYLIIYTLFYVNTHTFPEKENCLIKPKQCQLHLSVKTFKKNCLCCNKWPVESHFIHCLSFSAFKTESTEQIKAGCSYKSVSHLCGMVTVH